MLVVVVVVVVEEEIIMGFGGRLGDDSGREET